MTSWGLNPSACPPMRAPCGASWRAPGYSAAEMRGARRLE
jgi:hypothetical protein